MSQKGKMISKQSFLQKLIGWGIILVFAVLPLLYFPGRVASYVTSKQYFLIGIVDVLAIFWTWLLLIDKRYRLQKKSLFILLPLFLFLLSLTVSACVGVDPTTSFFSTVETGTGLIVLYHIFLFTCILASFIRVRQQTFLKNIFQATFFAAVVLAVMTFFTGANGLVDIHSQMLDGSSGGAMMGNSLLAGAYFIFPIFFTLYLIAHQSNIWKKILYCLGIASIIFSPIFFNIGAFKGIRIPSLYLFIGEARIATVALGIGLLLSFFIWLCTRKQREVSRIIGIAGIAIISVSFIVIVQQIARPTSSLHSFFVRQSGNRIIDWQEAIQGIKEKPLLGWGPENYHVVYQRYFNPVLTQLDHGVETWSLHPHNAILEILINGGVVGCIFYLFFLGTLFVGIFKLYRKNRIDGKTFALLISMLVAFIIQQQMIYDSIVSYTLFFSMLAIIAGLSDPVTDSRASVTYITSTGYAVAVVVSLLICPLWLYAAYLPARKTEEMQRVAGMTSDQRIGQYQHLFHSTGSYAIDTDVEFYTDPIFYSYVAQEEQLKNNPLYQKVSSQEIQSLLAAVYPIWKEKPYDYHLTLSLVQLENLEFYLTDDMRELANADTYASRGFILSPTDPQIYVAYAQTLAYEQNDAEAIHMLDKALVLNPTYEPAINLKSELNGG